MKDLVKTIKPVLKKYGVKKAALFGSHARGEETATSDVDILIEPPDDMGMTFIDLKNDLEDKLNKKVDLLSYNGLDKYLKGYILRDKKEIL